MRRERALRQDLAVTRTLVQMLLEQGTVMPDTVAERAQAEGAGTSLVLLPIRVLAAHGLLSFPRDPWGPVHLTLSGLYDLEHQPDLPERLVRAFHDDPRLPTDPA